MKNIKYTALIFLVTLCFWQQSQAQQQVMYTQYMFNGLALNPAYAGSHESISLTALAREQWVGVEGAPSTQTFSVHSPIKNEKVAVGLLALHDKIGVTEQTGVYASYAYRLPMNNKGKLAFGLQAGFNSYNANFSSVSDEDPTFMGRDVREMAPNFGAGVYYNTDRFYAGFSCPQILESTINRDNPDSDATIVRHFFASAGYVFDISPSVKLKPSTLVKMVEGAPVQFDINTNVIFRDVVWVGFSWRSFDSIDALFKLQVTDNLQFGYAWDFATTTELQRVNSGSHELMLNYRFSFDKTKVITPRYF